MVVFMEILDRTLAANVGLLSIETVEYVDSPGFEPGAFCMRSRRDTATPQAPCTEVSNRPQKLLEES